MTTPPPSPNSSQRGSGRSNNRRYRLPLILAFLGGWGGALYVCNCHCTMDSMVGQGSVDMRKTIGVPTASVANAKPTNRTALVFVTSSHEEYHTKKIKEMAQQFGNDFWVVWDSKKQPDCPHKEYAQCIDEWTLSKTNNLSHRCCAQEKSIMWAMDNRHSFDHVWFMEDDTHYTDMGTLVQIMNSQPKDSDVVNQERIYRAKDWWYENTTREAMRSVFSDQQLDQFHGHAMMNFYRLSQRYLESLHNVYQNMGEEWVFFESLFPTVAQVYGLKWTRYPRPIFSTRNRPCVTEFKEPGIYHPVKFRNGQFFPCHCFDSHCYTFPDNEECQPCAEIRAANIFDLTHDEKILAGLIDPEELYAPEPTVSTEG